MVWNIKLELEEDEKNWPIMQPFPFFKSIFQF